MKNRLLLAICGLLMVASHSAPADSSNCVSNDLFAWVDNREANAISPARWQAVRETLLGNEGGMTLDAMEVIYNRRVSNGWAAGHWVPIITAVKCLRTPPTPPPAEDSVDTPDTTPQQVENRTGVDITQPPADFFYFDDYDEMESGQRGSWTKRGTRQHYEWQRPGGQAHNQPMYAWNKWGPWNVLPEETRLAIHDLPSVGDMLTDRGLDDVAPMATNPTVRGSMTWEGPITGVLYPSSDVRLKDPTIVFRFDPNRQVQGYFMLQGAVRYTYRQTGRAAELDTWSALFFRDGEVRDWNAKDGPGDDGLYAQFYGDDDSNFLAGTVRRPRIIGTFVTGAGQ